MKNAYDLAAGRADRRQPPIPNVPTPAQRHARIVAAMRDNERYKGGPMMNTPLVPIAVLAIEIGADVDTLVRRLGDDLLVDAVGFRAIERHVAAQLIDEHRTRQIRDRQRETARRERLAEVSRRARATLRGPVPAVCDDAVADIMAVDGLPPRIREAESRLDAWLSGRSTAGRYTPTKAG